jgi:hypothetical protein
VAPPRAAQSSSRIPQLFPLFPKAAKPLIEDVVRFGVSITLQGDGRFETL